MFELTIKGVVYQFKFGVGFLKEISKTAQRPVDGVPDVKEDIGLNIAVGKIIDGDVLGLIDVLDLANKGKEPRVTRALLEEYVDDENTDIDKLFDDVLDFFGSANATKTVAKKLIGYVAKQEELMKKQPGLM